jgi:hypothetical protein
MSSTAATWDVGRIYATPDSPDHLRWFWSMNVNGPMTRAGHMPTLEEAKAQLQKSWGAWKAGRGRIGWRDRRFLLPKSEDLRSTLWLMVISIGRTMT